jgi:hypothetical protein
VDWYLAILVLGVVGLMMAAPAMSGTPDESEGDIVCAQTYHLSADELWLQFELWQAASMADDAELMAEYENTILAMITADIAVHQSELRELAEQVVLQAEEKNSGGADAEEPVDATTAETRARFRERLASLNTKEAMWLALSKSDNFSHKYRLLGDYINLLRKELKMPKTQLADAGRSSAGQSAAGDVSSPRQGPTE